MAFYAWVVFLEAKEAASRQVHISYLVHVGRAVEKGGWLWCPPAWALSLAWLWTSHMASELQCPHL